MEVIAGDAGQHYRRITWLVRAALGATGCDPPSLDGRLADATWEVLKSNEAHDFERDWGDLDTLDISAWVAHVADIPGVKADATAWYERTAQHALETRKDALIINGRQPREVLEGWLGRTGIKPTAEFWLECSPEEAARRVLLKGGRTEPLDSVEVGQQALLIEKRRFIDTQHKEFPVVEPLDAVPFVFLAETGRLQESAVRAILASRLVLGRGSDALIPHPIRFNTTTTSKEDMIYAASMLVEAAV